MRLQGRPLALFSAVLFAACAGAEVANAALGGIWQKLAPINSVVGLPAAACWILAAGALTTRAARGWFFPVLATYLAFVHGGVLMVTENRLGSSLFLVAGVVGVLSVRRLVLSYEGAEPWFSLGEGTVGEDDHAFQLPAILRRPVLAPIPVPVRV